MTIVNDDSCSISKWSSKLIDDARVIIYDCNVFIIQTTELTHEENHSGRLSDALKKKARVLLVHKCLHWQGESLSQWNISISTKDIRLAWNNLLVANTLACFPAALRKLVQAVLMFASKDLSSPIRVSTRVGSLLLQRNKLVCFSNKSVGMDKARAYLSGPTQGSIPIQRLDYSRKKFTMGKHSSLFSCCAKQVSSD
jgi:hypothetical protein